MVLSAPTLSLGPFDALRRVLAIALGALVLLSFAASAQDYPDPPFELRVQVGHTVNVCATGTIQCPAGGGRCDDPAVAVPEVGDNGLVFRGVGPGDTLCSAGATSGSGPRRVYLVKVRTSRSPRR